MESLSFAEYVHYRWKGETARSTELELLPRKIRRSEQRKIETTNYKVIFYR